MKVLVIGGTRFLGRWVVEGLLRRGHEVAVLHRGNTPSQSPAAKEILLDKNDRGRLKDLLTGTRFDAVIDTILSADDLRFVVPLLRDRISHYVHCGSTGVYAPMKFIPAREEDPCDPPHELGGFEAKLEQDRVLLKANAEYSFPATILRPTNIYGPGDVPLDIWGGRDKGFFRRLVRGEEITVPNDGRALIQPGYVKELGDAFSLPLGTEESVGEIYNISSPRAVTLDEYLRTMKEILGSSSSVGHMSLEELVAAYPQYLGSSSAGLRFVCEHMCVDIGKAKHGLGFSPQVSLEEGLTENFRWMRERGMLDA